MRTVPHLNSGIFRVAAVAPLRIRRDASSPSPAQTRRPAWVRHLCVPRERRRRVCVFEPRPLRQATGVSRS